MEPSSAILEAKELTIILGKTRALDNVSFSMKPGGITGLIGPSGSGKTTLMRAIVGAQQITSGSLTVMGMPAGSADLRSKIGYVTQSPAVYSDLTAAQNLMYFASILGLDRRAVTNALDIVDMGKNAKQLVGTMSGGQRARVSLAIALLGKPDILVMDEPTVGLDPVLRRHLWDLFGSLAAEGRTLLISSHVMDEAEQCPELLLLRDGAVLEYGSRQQLLDLTGNKSVTEAFLVLAGGKK